MKRKMISALLCATMVASMAAGCGSSGNDTSDNIFFNLGLDFTICFVVKYEMVIFGEVCPKIPEYIGRAK